MKQFYIRPNPPPSKAAINGVLDHFAELLSTGMSFDEIADRMSVSRAQPCVYYRMICDRLGWQAR